VCGVAAPRTGVHHDEVVTGRGAIAGRGGDACERIAGSGNGAGDADARSTGAGARILGGGVEGAATKMVEARCENLAFAGGRAG
jgi:hypothetical protein